jgi:hypothetical protein
VPAGKYWRQVSDSIFFVLSTARALFLNHFSFSENKNVIKNTFKKQGKATFTDLYTDKSGLDRMRICQTPAKYIYIYIYVAGSQMEIELRLAAVLACEKIMAVLAAHSPMLFPLSTIYMYIYIYIYVTSFVKQTQMASWTVFIL